MNAKCHEGLVEEIFDTVKDVRVAGQKEYAANTENCFANFERIAELQGLKREQVLMTYLLKHIDGVMSYVKGHKSQREDVRGRMVDIITYLTLLWGMIDENEDKGFDENEHRFDFHKNEEQLEVESKVLHKSDWVGEPERIFENKEE